MKGKHPGFKAVQKSIEGEGYGKKAAGAILAASSRNASSKAKKANPTTQSSERCAGERVSTVTVIKPGVSASCVKIARELLARCESGEILEFTAAVLLRNGNTLSLGTSLESRTRMAGMLLEAAMDRLEQKGIS